MIPNFSVSGDCLKNNYFFFDIRTNQTNKEDA